MKTKDKITQLIKNSSYTPKSSKQDIQNLIKDPLTKSIDVQTFIQLSYHILIKYINSDSNNPSTLPKDVYDLTCIKVKPNYLPCLIYEHLLESFCSLIQAINDKDQYLAEVEVEEIMQSIISYSLADDQNPHRGYQSFLALEITDNYYDIYQKQQFYYDTKELIDRFSNTKTTGNKIFTNKSKKVNQQSKLKQKRQKLKLRNQGKVQPLLQKLINKNKASPSSDNYLSQDKQYIISKAILQANY